MRTTLRAFFIAFFSLALFQSAFSQLTVASTNGYFVHITLQPVAVVPTAANCPNGFNYNVKLNYTITFTAPAGVTIPNRMYTLQANMGCTDGTQFFDLPVNGGSGTMTNRSNVWVATPTCATATLASLGCNQMQVLIEGPGISRRTVTAPMAISLPVKWEKFDAALQGSVVKLSWSTFTETNNQSFTVERSINGAEWTAVKTIAGAGNSGQTKSYAVYDESPLAGTSYYRVRQTDFDGSTSISETRTIKNTNVAAKGISIYPVPNAGNTITINGITINGNNHELAVLNSNGTQVYATKLQRNTLDLPSLKPGVYFIRITDKASGETSTQRYIKL